MGGGRGERGRGATGRFLRTCLETTRSTRTAAADPAMCNPVSRKKSFNSRAHSCPRAVCPRVYV